MLEHNEDRDKVRADREKKIKGVNKTRADRHRMDQELRDIAKGKIDPLDFDEANDL